MNLFFRKMTLNNLVVLLFLFISDILYSGSLTVNSVIHKDIECGVSGPEDINGSIYLTFTPSAGEYPTSVIWTYPDNSTSSGAFHRSSLSLIGDYEIDVVTNQGSYTRVVTLGYKVQWDAYASSISEFTAYGEDFVNKRGASGWCASAGSKAILPGGEDGWMSYRVTNTSVPRMFGFDIASRPTNCYGGIDYGVYLRTNAGVSRLIGTSQASAGTYQAGDEIRVERIQSGGNYYVRLFKNGVQISSTSITLARYNEDWIAGAWVHSNNGRLENMCTSFKPPFDVDVNITNLSCTGSDNGEIYLEMCGDSTLYTIDWEDVSVGDYFHTKGLSEGLYHATIKKGSDWQVDKWISVGYRVDWSDETGVVTTSNDVEKTGATGWNSGVVSEKTINASTEGWYEFEVDSESKLLKFGFSVSPASYAYSSLDMGYDRRAGEVQWLMSGASSIGAYPKGILRNGDIVRFHVDPNVSGRIDLYINNHWRGARNVLDDFSASDELNIHVLMYTTGAKLNDFRWSVPCDPSIDFRYYANLKETVDANYIIVDNDTINFYLQAYNQKETNKFLEYKIINQYGSIVAGVDNSGNLLIGGSPKLAYKFDDNYYDMDLTLLSLSSGIYLLEVKTENGLIKKLKFRK